jgi:hypothetical protein
VRIKALERKVRDAPSQRNPAQGIRLFYPVGAGPPIEMMKSFIDDHLYVYGVEPTCALGYLQSVADCPIDLLPTCQTPGRSLEKIDECPAR